MSLCLIIWVLASLCFCVYVSLCVSVCVCVSVCLCVSVSLGLWVSGSLGLWVSGSLGPFVFVSLCLCLCGARGSKSSRVFGHLPLGDQIELTVLLLYISSQQSRSAYEMFFTF